MSNSLTPTFRYTVLFHSSLLGGAERSALELVQALIKNGNLITCLVPDGPNELSEMLQTAGAKVERLTSIIWWTHQPLTAIEKTQEVESCLERIATDIVLTITGVIPQAAIAARKLGIPHIWFLHEFIDKDHGLEIPFNRGVFSRFVLEYSEKIICNSRTVQEYFFPESHDKVTFLYPFPTGIGDKKVFNPKDLHTPLELGVVANFSQGKGHLIMLSALSKLLNSGFNVRVNFFGNLGTSELRDQIDAYINLNNLEKKVSFKGFVSSREEIFESIDAVVISSPNEAFGRVPFEAMSYAVPVIYSKSGGLVEYIIPEKTGVSFEANDSVSLANSIRKLADPKFDLPGLILSGQAFVRNINNTNSYVSAVAAISKSVVQDFKKLPLQNSSNVLIDEYLSVTRQRDDLTRQRDDLTRQRDDLTRQRDDLTRQRDDLTRQRDDLWNSTTWKVTKPIRALINFFRKRP